MAFSSFARRRAVDFWPTQWRHAQGTPPKLLTRRRGCFLRRRYRRSSTRESCSHAENPLFSSGTYRTYFNRELCEEAVAPEVSRERKDETEGVRTSG